MQKHISKVWIDGERIYASTEDGLIASYSFAQWPILANATPKERENFTLSYTGIHWPDLDEDLSFEGLFADNNLGTLTACEDSVCYVKSNPEE